ncbi:MAG: twin-arginine translocation signal domain-containing protein, partial [Burkholderiaceae bacterium]|nr:twin-arginine translocation signal domain-containing protein [Burkholderiaceae bacterium]
MTQNRRDVLKSTGAMALLLSLGIVTTQQAMAAGRAGFDAKNLADAINALGGSPATSDQITITS